MIGWMVADAMEIPISFCEMRGGQLHLIGMIFGPTEAVDGALAIRGSDGHLWVVAGNHLTLRALGKRERFRLHMRIDVVSVEAAAPVVIHG